MTTPISQSVAASPRTVEHSTHHGLAARARRGRPGRTARAPTRHVHDMLIHVSKGGDIRARAGHLLCKCTGCYNSITAMNTCNMLRSPNHAAPMDLCRWSEVSHTCAHCTSKKIDGKKRTATTASVDHSAFHHSNQHRDGVAEPCDAFAALLLVPKSFTPDEVGDTPAPRTCFA